MPTAIPEPAVDSPSTVLRSRRRRRLARIGALTAAAGVLTAVGVTSTAVADAPPLSSVYVGTIWGDFGSAANLTYQMSGPPTAVTAATTIGAGLHLDCHGDNAVGFRQLTLTGHRTVVNADNTSNYELTGRFEFDATVHVVVDLAVHGLLSADARTFNGTVDITVRPSFGSNCVRTFSFATANDVRIVPDLIDETWVYARDALVALNLVPVRSTSIDYTCNHQGTVWRVHPRAGTFVPVWSTVQVVIGVRDYRRPCP